jgi:hypothetical protein
MFGSKLLNEMSPLKDLLIPVLNNHEQFFGYLADFGKEMRFLKPSIFAHLLLKPPPYLSAVAKIKRMVFRKCTAIVRLFILDRFLSRRHS